MCVHTEPYRNMTTAYRFLLSTFFKKNQYLEEQRNRFLSNLIGSGIGQISEELAHFVAREFLPTDPFLYLYHSLGRTYSFVTYTYRSL